MKKLLLKRAFYEDFEDCKIIGIVKDVEKVPTIIEEDFKNIFSETAKSEGFARDGVSYQKNIDISFDTEYHLYTVKGKIIDVEMKKEFDELPDDLKNDSIRAFMAPEFELEMFYHLEEVEEL